MSINHNELQSKNLDADTIEKDKHALAYYHFSHDELKTLQECNIEAFYQRSLPLGTSLGLAAYWAVKRGFLNGNVKYGATPKVVVSVIFGYFLGKFSYQTRCAEKLIKLPNSKLAEILKQKKNGRLYNTFADQANTGLTVPLFSSPDNSNNEENQLRLSHFNLDADIPDHFGFDDTYRPSLDSSQSFEEELQFGSLQPATTYEELRRLNREKFGKLEKNVSTQDIKSVNLLEFNESAEDVRKTRNQYGDL